MKETNWERLHRIAHERVAHLALRQDEFKAAGGPSPAWYRRLDKYEGGVTSYNRESLDKLDVLCRWPAGTSQRIIREATDLSDNPQTSAALLADQEQELIYGDGLNVSRQIRAFQTIAARMLSNMRPEDAADAMRTIYHVLGWPDESGERDER